MTCDTLQSSLLEELPRELDYSLAPQPGLLVCDPATPYRPRHPEETALYQLFENHFDSHVRAYEERFEPQHGPLRPLVVRSVEQFLACGRLEGGFARLRCPKCHAEHLVPFSPTYKEIYLGAGGESASWLDMGRDIRQRNPDKRRISGRSEPFERLGTRQFAACPDS